MSAEERFREVMKMCFRDRRYIFFLAGLFFAVLVLKPVIPGRFLIMIRPPEDRREEKVPQSHLVPVGQDMVTREIHRFIDDRVERATLSRRIYWKRDFSTLDKYLNGIERYREDLSKFYRVPEDCRSAEVPIRVSETFVGSVGDVDIHRWVLTLCNGQLTTVGLVGVRSGAKKPLPLVIAIHGTAGSPERIFGLDGKEDYHHRFALRLAERGYFVFAPLIVTELAANTHGSFNRSRNEVDNRGLSVGVRLAGIELGQIMGVIDYLLAGEVVDPHRVAVYGISLGGFLAFNLAALDTRIGVVVVSQYFEDMEGKFTGLEYPHPYWRYEDADYIFFQDILERFSSVDIASLIVPRKLFIEVGLQDPRVEPAKKNVREIKSIYSRLGLPEDSVQLGLEKGGHEVFLKGSLQFLNRYLHP